jgi:PAS domain S-box-containing protein/excisionase family DNA binding protein
MLTTGETARLLGVTSQTVVNWIEAGRIPAVRVGRGRRRIACACLRQFAQENGIPARTNAPDLWERIEAVTTSQLPDLVPAVIAIDAQGLVIFWNRSAENLLGWSGHEREGRSVSEVPVQVPGLPVDLADLARQPGEEVRMSLHLEYTHRDGHTVYTETTASWIRDAQGGVVGTVFVVQPVVVAAPAKPTRLRKRRKEP